MKYRLQDGGGDLFAFIDHQKKTAGRQIGITKLNGVIDWEGFRDELDDRTETSEPTQRPVEPDLQSGSLRLSLPMSLQIAPPKAGQMLRSPESTQLTTGESGLQTLHRPAYFAKFRKKIS